jgi:hypothetical protein
MQVLSYEELKKRSPQQAHLDRWLGEGKVATNRSSSKRRSKAQLLSPGRILQSTDPNTEVALKKYMNSLRSSEDKRIRQRSESLHQSTGCLGKPSKMRIV